MQTHLFKNARIAAITIFSVTIGSLAVGITTAQQPSAAKSSSAPSASASANAASDAAAREKMMNSAEWKQIGTQYQQWLTTQPIYSPSQIKKINQELDAQIQNMPTSELQGFMDDWQAKLKVLNGKDFQEEQNWLGAYMTNMAEGYRRNYLQQMGLTNIPSMSAAQLEDAITDIRVNQASIAQSQAAFNASRQQSVQYAQQQDAASMQAQQQQSNSYKTSSGFNTFQSPYRPPKFNPPPNPQMKFWMNTDGQLSYALPL